MIEVMKVCDWKYPDGKRCQHIVEPRSDYCWIHIDAMTKIKEARRRAAAHD